jgi:tetratricopeptide (TPR) repeat protein
MPSKRTTIHLFVLGIAVFAVFGRCLLNGFVWDDVALLVNNPVYRNFDLRRMLFSLGNGVEYLPVRDISFALDWLLWGGNPVGFHLTNLLLYWANGITLFFLIRNVVHRLPSTAHKDFAEPAAVVTTLLFMLHPLHVEAVCFITCRNVLLSGLFTFISILLFLRFTSVDSRKPLLYAASLGFFILALFSKATAIILPLLLLATILVSSRNKRTEQALWTLPFFAIAGGVFFLFRAIGRASNLIQPATHSNAAETAAIALQIPWFYLKKLLLPLGLSSEYAETFSKYPSSTPVIFALLGLVALAATCWAVRKRYPAAPLAFLWFMAALLPVMHFFPTYPVVADRYAYLPTLGFCMIAGVALSRALRGPVLVVVIAVLFTWGTLSYLRVPVWRSEKALWEDVIQKYPRHVKAYNSLGALYFQEGNFKRAFGLFQTAQEIDPSSPMYDYSLGFLQYKRGNYRDALELLQLALTRNDHFIMALYDLGMTYEKLGEREKAIDAFRRVLGSTDSDPLGFYKNAARQHLHQLGAETVN